jgi:hypothetical protein
MSNEKESVLKRAKGIVKGCDGDRALLATVHTVLIERALGKIADAIHRRTEDAYADEPDEQPTPHAKDEVIPQEQQDKGEE